MIIDKELNLDTELEYLKDGSLIFAQNIITSNDGLTIQNEPAIQSFINDKHFGMAGFVACNEEFVLFGKNNSIVRINKEGVSKECETAWRWEGGEVFGTYSYNVNNELIVAISERNLPDGVDCPLKVINLDRDKKINNSIYTLTPNIPKSNMTNIEYILGDRIKKGKYNFFIKYHVNDDYETTWFPIGIPVFVYDNITSNEVKPLIDENIQIVDELNDNGVPTRLGGVAIHLNDFYQKDYEYTNNNVLLTFEINDTIDYTHYTIGYIVNSKSGIEGRKTNKIDISTAKVQIGIYSEPVSVDELTIGAFNIYNVNTMCNYKNRLYLANYKEENRNNNDIISKIDTTGIKVFYNKDDIKIPMAFETNYVDSNNQVFFNTDLKDQWKSKPGRFGIYNFFIHYVYPNGNFTDGIKIGSNVATAAVEEIPSNLIELEHYQNSKGDVLFKAPTDSAINTRKFWFTGIKMYPEFVGYFISYEEPEYIQIGEGFLASDSIDRDNKDRTLNHMALNNSVFKSNLWRFYYPEFSIVGGKTNVTNLYHTGNNVHMGLHHQQNDFVGSDEKYDVINSISVAPNDVNNLGREGYLKLNTADTVTINHGTTNKTFTAVSNNTDIYLSDTKKLISLGYIKYVNYSDNDFTYGFEDVPYNYDFYRCFSSIIFFARSGIIVNQTSPNPINASSGDEYYQFINDSVTYDESHINKVSYWHETHYPLFLKEINQEPESIFYSYYRKLRNNKAEQYQLRNLVGNPNYINDLYKLDNVYYDYTGKLYTNYDEKLLSSIMNQYNKTIRRSDVIQSESLVNSWKYFRPENYKIITENKGNITNVTGIGNYLFAHCEHSLFVFDVTDSLQTLDKNVQLFQPDSFEVEYKEVFTADKGYGGLQDYSSWICDEFGYIFFDKSANKIYRYDAGKLLTISENINNFLKMFKPINIFMGNDRLRNRIMFKFVNDNNTVIFSYSTIHNNWLSTHSYSMNGKFIGLKDELYFTQDVKIIVTDPNKEAYETYVYKWADNQYNNYNNIDKTNIIYTKDSNISFIDVIFTNSNYNKIKVLDFITYILNKEPNDNFELLQIELYTNCCYSGVLDISEERKKVTEYKKPYYDFERWNFNYFRNVIDKIENGDVINRLTGAPNDLEQKVQRGYDNALISGKYVAVRFSFKNTTKQINIKDIQCYFKP